MKRFYLTVALLTALPLSAAPQEQVFETPYWTDAPVIEAIGRANLEVAPNRASFNVSFIETDRDAKDAMRLAVERARLAYDAIKVLSGDASRVETSVNVNPYYEQYRDKGGDRIENRRADKVKGYEATAYISVTLTDVSVAGEARAAALALGPENSSGLRTYLERTAEVNRQAYEAAVSDAADRARLSATAAGATLGKLMVIQEGNGPCLGRWTTQPGTVRQRAQYAPAAPRKLETVTVTGSNLATGSIAGETVDISKADIAALNLPSDQAPQYVQSSVCAIYAVGATSTYSATQTQ